MWTELAYAFGVWVCQFLTHGLAQQLMTISMSRNVDHQCKDCRLDIEVGVTCVPSLNGTSAISPANIGAELAILKESKRVG